MNNYIDEKENFSRFLFQTMDTTKDEFNIPDIIIDPRTRTQYSKGKFLGKVNISHSVTIIHWTNCSRVVLPDVMN